MIIGFLIINIAITDIIIIIIRVANLIFLQSKRIYAMQFTPFHAMFEPLILSETFLQQFVINTTNIQGVYVDLI